MDWCKGKEFPTNRKKIPRCVLGPQRGIVMNKGMSRMCDGCSDGRQNGANYIQNICPSVFSSFVCHMLSQLIVSPSYTNSAEYTTPDIVTSTSIFVPVVVPG